MQCFVQQRKIQVIESHRDYLKIYAGDKKFESYKTLKMLEKELDENLFILPYRGYLINLMHIVGIENGMIQMKGGFKIPISRRNKKGILQKIIDFDKFKN